MNDNSYIDWSSMTDTALIKMIGAFVQHHRLNQNRTQSDIAKSADISRSTLSLLERGEKVTLNSLMRVLRVLDLLYIMDVFKVNNQISPIAYAKLQKGKRNRASNKDGTSNEAVEW